MMDQKIPQCGVTFTHDPHAYIITILSKEPVLVVCKGEANKERVTTTEKDKKNV